MRQSPLVIAICLAALAGCAQFPEADATITPEAEAADFPELVPLEPLLAEIDTQQLDAPATEAALLARVAGLKARAARLSGAGLDPEDRKRLQSGVN